MKRAHPTDANSHSYASHTLGGVRWYTARRMVSTETHANRHSRQNRKRPQTSTAVPTSETPGGSHATTVTFGSFDSCATTSSATHRRRQGAPSGCSHTGEQGHTTTHDAGRTGRTDTRGRGLEVAVGGVKANSQRRGVSEHRTAQGQLWRERVVTGRAGRQQTLHDSDEVLDTLAHRPTHGPNRLVACATRNSHTVPGRTGRKFVLNTAFPSATSRGRDDPRNSWWGARIQVRAGDVTMLTFQTHAPLRPLFLGTADPRPVTRWGVGLKPYSPQKWPAATVTQRDTR